MSGGFTNVNVDVLMFSVNVVVVILYEGLWNYWLFMFWAEKNTKNQTKSQIPAARQMK